MMKPYRNILFILLVSLSLLSGCSGQSQTIKSSHFPVTVFSDVHFDPFYDPSLFPQLVAADPRDWGGIFKTSSIKTPSGYGSGTNYPLLLLALKSVRENLGETPLAVFTGDILVHKFSQTFFKLYGSQDIAAMQAFTDKTVAFFAEEVRGTVGNLPVMFAVGNNDSYADLGPDSTFLSNTAEIYYAKFLNGSVERQEFLATYQKGGYYSADLAGTDLVVIGLNTVPFYFASSSDSGSGVNQQLIWLDAKLASAKAKGKKVWLLMHAPPGADYYLTAKSMDTSGHITQATAAMMWNADNQTLFQQTVAKYPGSISMTLAGHTHMDEYRILPSSDVVEITPSIGARSGNNPAFKLFTISGDTFKATDYKAYNYDLSTMPAEFTPCYSFSTTYSSQGSLNDSLLKLFPALMKDDSKQAHYRGYYYSGNNASNSITGLNWPIYWCGTGKMNQQEFIDCVNSY